MVSYGPTGHDVTSNHLGKFGSRLLMEISRKLSHFRESSICRQNGRQVRSQGLWSRPVRCRHSILTPVKLYSNHKTNILIIVTTLHVRNNNQNYISMSNFRLNPSTGGLISLLYPPNRHSCCHSIRHGDMGRRSVSLNTHSQSLTR
ncbi:hypothetical protein AVEN_231278-1 [Araneus ventricosus]|uniref:Uncharacterized protein n=1 Tax=Araneus ventricosus TaxID=182803 RepID=A0A4Y2CIQ4_ARAVE|nr:hypothetical protein AVEN_231278-1 [Araneus ventricosus]